MNRFKMKMERQNNLFVLHDLHIIWITGIAPDKKLKETAQAMLKESQKYEKRPLFFGIGKKYDGPQWGRQSYLEAVKAAAIADIRRPVIDWRADIASIALANIPQALKKECADLMFGALSETEIKDTVNFVTTWLECNGSINEAAGRLYMHKNTVQYRISKISERLGFDIRDLNNQLRLQMALWLKRFDKTLD